MVVLWCLTPLSTIFQFTPIEVLLHLKFILLFKKEFISMIVTFLLLIQCRPSELKQRLSGLRKRHSRQTGGKYKKTNEEVEKYGLSLHN
jgi:hypothetical protein